MRNKVENPMYFIYKYTFPNGKVYIGQTHEGSGRYGGSIANYKSCTFVYRAMKKYKKYDKEILEYCTIENVNEREKYYIAKYQSTEEDKGYNLSSGGYSLKPGHTPWNKGIKTGIAPPNKGKKQSEWLSPESIAKIKKNLKPGNPKASFKKGNIPWNIHKTFVKDTITGELKEFNSTEEAFISLGYKSNKNSGRYVNKDKLVKNRYLIFTE